MNREHCVFYGSQLTQLRSCSTHANIIPIFSFVQLCPEGYLAQLTRFYTIQQISVVFALLAKDMLFRLNLIVP